MKLFELKKSIDMNKFESVFTPDVKKVIEIIRKYKFDVRIVGGCVRDFIMGVAPRDIDFATDADPVELIFIFDLEGIQYDVKGISHGTVKAVFGKNKIDVTSIHYKLRNDGTKIIIDRTKTWEEDANKRDLTINSMSVDLNGTLYDYCGGIKDIDNQTVRFTKGSIEKLKYDPRNMIRWFKGLSLFEHPKFVKSDYELIKSYASNAKDLLDDDVTQRTLAGILKTPNSNKIISLIYKSGVGGNLKLNCN
jgi:tRNA nucleotidyltransferase/poly(A) polymerase